MTTRRRRRRAQRPGTYEIVRRTTGALIFTCEATSLCDAVEQAVRARVRLAGAYLWQADLENADLAGAELPRAYLSGANLRGVDLTHADLTHANLKDCDMRGATLHGVKGLPVAS